MNTNMSHDMNTNISHVGMKGERIRGLSEEWRYMKGIEAYAKEWRVMRGINKSDRNGGTSRKRNGGTSRVM